MAEKIIERQYVIPLRKFWLRVPEYERAGKAVKAVKQFVAKHMKVEDRDLDKVKLSSYFNNEMWRRGKTKPPAKVKVKVVKEDGIVKVDFVEMPEYVKFLKAKNDKKHKKVEKMPEKEKATEEQNIKEAKIESKVAKQVGKVEKVSHPHRMALQK